MLGNDLYQIIQRDTRLSVRFKGVYAANELPKRLPFCSIVIVNCCNRNKPGEHWIALCQESESKLEMLDSYGHEPEMYNLKNKLPNSEIIVFNTKQLQSLASEVYGHYCLYYCYFKSHSHSMAEIVSATFSNDTKNNDQRVYKYVKKLFNLK